MYRIIDRIILAFVTIGVILLLFLILYIKEAIQKRIQAYTMRRQAARKPDAGPATREWLTVGRYEIFIHNVVDEHIQSRSSRERIFYVEVEYRNQSGEENQSCRRNQWLLYARDGYSYEAEADLVAPYLYSEKRYFGGERYIDHNMNARGWFAFKVPEEADIIILQFVTEFLRTRTVNINISRAIEMENYAFAGNTAQ